MESVLSAPGPGSIPGQVTQVPASCEAWPKIRNKYRVSVYIFSQKSEMVKESMISGAYSSIKIFDD